MMAMERDVAGPPKMTAISRAAINVLEAEGEPAEPGRNDESGHTEGEGLAPVEPIEKQRTDQPGQKRGESVGSSDQADPFASGMPSPLAKSPPSGITIMKSRMLINWIAAIRRTMLRSDLVSPVIEAILFPES